MAPFLTRLGNGGSSGSFGFGRRKISSSAGNTFSATGGNIDGITPGNGYKYHVFTSPGSFQVNSNITAEFIVVGGGGAGGVGGGGAGGIVYHPGLSISSGTYNVTVGPGGTFTPRSTVKGSDSSIAFPTTYTATGGGGGAQMDEQFPETGQDGHGQPGGSGGGASRDWPGGGSQPGGSAENPFTNPGATEYGTPGGSSSPTEGGNDHRGGGGGGAGSAGGSGVNSVAPGGNGQPFPAFAAPLLPGLPSPWQSAVGPTGLYGGGGGGGKGQPNNPTTRSSGGSGGGGTGGIGAPNTAPVDYPGEPGIDFTGGGGGGAGQGPGSGNSGGNGGTGIVIIRYLA